jgi:uncharacterized protein (DUF4213/DUF364 family)
MSTPTLLDQCRGKLRELVTRHQLDGAVVTVLAKALTPEEAIGAPTRRDYPILEGKERVIEAAVLGARGQAFTDSPSDFSGQLREVLALPLTSNRNRAVFIATMNAVLRSLGEIEGVLHCQDDAPERCAAEIAAAARGTGASSVGLIGFNPGMADALVREFGADGVRITDMNPQNVGACKFGVAIWDGRTQTRQLIRCSDLVIVTGTTLVNGTFDEILRLSGEEGKPLVIFGITAAAVCQLMGLERWCAQARNG